MSFEIKIINIYKRERYDFNIGRGPHKSPLMNEAEIGKDGTREVVIQKYQAKFDAAIASRDPEILAELRSIYLKGLENGRVVLGCWCKQAKKEVACHGDIIKAFLERPDAYELMGLDPEELSEYKKEMESEK